MLKKIVPFLVLLVSVASVMAQDATSQTATAQQSPDPQQQQDEKAKLEKKALALLEQVVTESQGLKLPENKLRVQIAAADMLWDKNPPRARGLLTDAGATHIGAWAATVKLIASATGGLLVPTMTLWVWLAV